MVNNNLLTLTIKDLFSGDDKYLIPIYQRNFAWGEREITQMIQDIADYAAQNIEHDGSNNVKYYIGTLVVAEREKSSYSLFETIDGQQRLTTLTILLNAIKHNFEENSSSIQNWLRLNLEFESRPISTVTLQAISKSRPNHSQNFNSDIVQAYNDAIKALNRIIREKKLTEEQFCKYLFNHVTILRVVVPEDTDLNHYFEIMNNRGEQLEKHEIVKARLMDFLKEDEAAKKTFNTIWEACSNMEKYVQYGFNVDSRHTIFGREDWNRLDVDCFDDINSAMAFQSKDTTDTYHSNLRLEDIINNKEKLEVNNNDTDGGNERFYSPVTFPNFLLHILRVQTGADIQLDDKQLISVFENHYKKLSYDDAIGFVKKFAFYLLKGRFLFDKYIIKRELKGDKEEWSLQRLKNREQGNSFTGYYIKTFGEEENESEKDIQDNKTVIMLLSMFHVSAPTMIYKHWLNAAMKYLFENENTSASAYIAYLEDLAKSYFFNRYVAVNPIDYFEIIYENKGKHVESSIDRSILDRGTSVENFVFNYLDYKLWKKQLGNYKIFEFSFKSSVEHYYPQNPILEENRFDQEVLDLFGNLCLLSRSKNSTLGRNLPNQKKEHYGSKNVTTDSLKQDIMLSYETWNKTQIREHGEEMKNILFKMD